MFSTPNVHLQFPRELGEEDALILKPPPEVPPLLPPVHLGGSSVQQQQQPRPGAESWSHRDAMSSAGKTLPLAFKVGPARPGPTRP